MSYPSDFSPYCSSRSREQHVIRVYGRTLGAPRRSVWYGDPGAAYSYSGIHLDPLPWTEVLLEIKRVVDQLAATQFNGVPLNLYRDGRGVAWHSDAEAELGRNPVIASVSLGATRRFVLQDKNLNDRRTLELAPGTVLLMGGRTQHCWHHQVPKNSRPVGPRINLSFRVIRREESGRTGLART